MRDVLAWAAGSTGAAFLLAARVNLDGLPSERASIVFLEYALVMALLLGGALHDARRRTIPDAVPAGIAGIHLLCIAALGLAGGTDAMQLAAASLAGGLALGGGLLGFTLAYERIAHPGAFGGGDIKLMAALGFALGCERAVTILLVACVIFAGWMGMAAVRAHVAGRMASTSGPFAPSIAFAAFCLLLAT